MALVAWYDFSDASTVFEDTARTDAAEADDTIAGVTDKSGSGNHLIQSTAGNRPQWKSSIRNGLSIARFDLDDWLQVTATPVSGDATIFAVASPDSGGVELLTFAQRAAANETPIRAQVTVNESGGQSRSTVDHRNDANTLTRSIMGSGDIDETWVCLSGHYSGATQTLRNNGIQQDQDTNAGGATTTDTCYIGSYKGTFGKGGDIGEIMVYNEALSLESLIGVDWSLRVKWGITTKPIILRAGVGRPAGSNF